MPSMVAAPAHAGIRAFPNLYRSLAKYSPDTPPPLTEPRLRSIQSNRTEAQVNRKHAFTISLAAAIAAIAGVFAATKSVHLGHSAAAPLTTTSSVVASRTAVLDRTEAALRKALAQKPPRLPSLPATLPARLAAAQQPAQRVTYVRPAPRIVTIHRHSGEHEGERVAEGAEHEGGGFDD